MSRDAATRTPSPPPLQSTNTQQSAGTAFFLRERARLVAEIGESIGQILNHSNALNRKLEESLLVGHEFEPVARLWGNFAASMGALDPNSVEAQQQQQQQHDGNAGAGGEGDETIIEQNRDDGAAAANEGGAEAKTTLSQSQAGQQQPPQPHVPVAPGGGNWSTVG